MFLTFKVTREIEPVGLPALYPPLYQAPPPPEFPSLSGLTVALLVSLAGRLELPFSPQKGTAPFSEPLSFRVFPRLGTSAAPPAPGSVRGLSGTWEWSDMSAAVNFPSLAFWQARGPPRL